MYFCHEATAPTQIVNLQYLLDMMVFLVIENIPLSTSVEISYSNYSQSLADRRYGWSGGEVVGCKFD